ncbi:MAG: alpha/beta hydrolase fold domain-containing protein [Chloroflexia bacterium]
MGRKRLLRVGFVLLLLLLGVPLAWVYAAPNPAPSTPRVTPESGIVRANLTYCRGGDADLKLDLYLPQPLDAGPVPVAVYVHGGGWQEGDKTWITRILPAERLVARGYAVAALDYRLAPRYPWPAPINDAKCAIRFLRAEAATYGLDAGRIGVWGESAGGQLAAMLGLAGPDAGLEGNGGYADQSSRVQAVVTMSAPTDFTGLDLNPLNRVSSQMLLGKQPDAALLRQVSPVTYATASAPPFLIFHGDSDAIVSPRHAQALYDALRRAGAAPTLVTVKHGGHVFAPVGGTASPNIAEIDAQVIDFFDRELHNTAAFRTFTQTGKTVRGPFLTYWQDGGTARFGYPISEALQETGADGKQYVTQYFQRAVLTWHPDSPPTARVVPLPLGSIRLAQKYPQGAPGQGQRPVGAFLQTWQALGGLSALGPAISGELTEASELDGRTYQVQYFESGMLEYHPDAVPPQALLAQLGTLRYRALYMAGH